MARPRPRLSSQDLADAPLEWLLPFLRGTPSMKWLLNERKEPPPKNVVIRVDP